MTPLQANVLALQRLAGNAAVDFASQAARNITLALDALVEHAEGLLGRDLTVHLRLALLGLTSDIANYTTMLDVALITAETEQMQADTERLNLHTDHVLGHPGFRAGERLRVLSEIAGGVTGDIALTDIVFFERHPERRDRPLAPGDPADRDLIDEWRTIRTSLVGQVLNSQLGRAVRVAPAAKGAAEHPADAPKPP